jgi:hypothetical protein
MLHPPVITTETGPVGGAGNTASTYQGAHKTKNHLPTHAIIKTNPRSDTAVSHPNQQIQNGALLSPNTHPPPFHLGVCRLRPVAKNHTGAMKVNWNRN